MEVASHSYMASSHQDMDTMDIDIDMDVDVDFDVDVDEVPVAIEPELEEGEEPEFPVAPGAEPMIPAIYTEDPLLELQPEKVYIRGLDDFHTNDILAFAGDHFAEAEPVHVQWIDDTSANIIYASKDLAVRALLSFNLSSISAETVHNAPLELRPAKQLASRPTASLEVRVATVGDKKKKNAAESSRFYLLHREHDPAERGDYKRRKYDDREHRRRNDGDKNRDVGNDFTASMYDDTPATNGETTAPARGRDLFSRVSGPDRRTGRRRSASPGRSNSRGNSDEIDVDVSDEDEDAPSRRRPRRDDYRKRDPPPYNRRDPAPFPRDNAGKELFGTSNDTRSRGGGLVSDKLEHKASPAITSTTSSRKVDQNSSVANRLRADLQAAQTSPGRGTHRRSHAMDAKNAEDLNERFGRKSLSIDSTGKVELFPHMAVGSGSGLNIRGTADHQGISIKGAGGFSIKGRAAEPKELFPDQYGKGNAGKELFDQPVRERRIRARADDYH